MRWRVRFCLLAMSTNEQGNVRNHAKLAELMTAAPMSAEVHAAVQANGRKVVD